MLLNVCPECFVFDAYWGGDSDWPITDSVSESELLSSSEVLSEGLEGLWRLHRSGLDSFIFFGRGCLRLTFWSLVVNFCEVEFGTDEVAVYVGHFRVYSSSRSERGAR